MDPTLISLVAFAAVASLVGAVAFLMRDLGSSSVEDRLEVMTGRRRQEDIVTKDVLIRDGMEGLTGVFGKFSERLQRLALLFEQADSPMKPEMFFGVSVGMAVVGVVGGVIARARFRSCPSAR